MTLLSHLHRRAALGDESAREALELSCPYTRMFFGAIEDLERITATMAARDAWHQALAAYLAAHAAATREGIPEAEVDELSGADSAAFRAMVATPAPDMAALRTKMEIGLTHVWSQCHAEPGEIAALLADVSRLAGEA